MNATTVRSLQQGDALPSSPFIGEYAQDHVAGTAAIIAVGTWATATTGSQNQDGFSGTWINAFELVNSKELPAQRYDMS